MKHAGKQKPQKASQYLEFHSGLDFTQNLCSHLRFPMHHPLTVVSSSPFGALKLSCFNEQLIGSFLICVFLPRAGQLLC